MNRSVLALPALALALGACAMPSTKEPVPLPLAGTKWILVTERKLEGEQPYLEFGDGALSGYSGCNRLMGRYVMDAVGAGAIVFSQVASSKRMCDAVSMAVEDRMLATLRTSTSLLIRGNTLRLDGSAGSLTLVGDGAASNVPKVRP